MTNQNPLISVIVPVYKVEKYLHRCVDSILAQTYTNLEIILIDDGSPDRSGEICDEYAAKDSRIRVIHQKNAGLGAARNAGLDVCSGEYIAFVDSDDYILPEMYGQMLVTAREHDVDICMCQWQYEYADGRHPVTPEMIDPAIFNVTTTRELARFFYKKIYDNMTAIVVWTKLFKRALFADLRFSDRAMEDQIIFATMYSRDFSVFVMPQFFYVYTENPSSLTHMPFNQNHLRFLDVLQMLYHLYRDDPFMKYESLVRYANIYIEYFFKSQKFDLNMPDRKHFICCVRELARNRKCNLKFYIRMMLFLIHPGLYRFLVSRFSTSQ